MREPSREEVEVTAESLADDELQRARLAARRSELELGRALTRLDRSIREPFSIKHRIVEAPERWIVGAFIIGFILGSRRAGRG